MPWYRVRFSLDEIATGRHIRLQNMFETLFHSTSEPAGAAMFVSGDAQDEYTYYFSSPCAVFCADMLSAFAASTCKPPVPQSIIWLAGDVGARGAVPRS
jgi:hypothetical protein